MNKVILQGRLTADVELKQFGKGDDKNVLANFTVACRDYKDADGEWVTQFIRCTAFGKPAEILEKFTGKGQPICISGKLRNSVYEDEDGQSHYNTNVIVEDFDLISARKADEDEEDERPAKSSKYAAKKAKR